jgi:hypothetical protein
VFVESYVIRIYRRGEDKTDDVVGILESVETGKKQAFKNMDELVRSLKGSKRKSSPKGKKSNQEIKRKQGNFE